MDETNRSVFEWMILPLKRYAEFSGRSRRKEYWWYSLLIAVVSVVLQFTVGATVDPGNPFAFPALFGGWPSFLLFLVTIIPSLAVSVRRLHDINRSGWWNLIILIPLIGAIVLLVWFVLKGERGPNRFDPDPKAPATVDPAVFA